MGQIPTPPGLIPMPFAQSGERSTIPTTVDVAGAPNASWSVGFPSITRISRNAGGKAPLGIDFQSLNYNITHHLHWLQSGCKYPWNATLDYLAGSEVIGSDGNTYRALLPSGPDVPNSGGYVGPIDPVTDADASIYWVNDLESQADFQELIIQNNSDADTQAAAHNNIYRGKDLTNVYTLAELSAKLTAGDFSDLYIGDYITRPFTHGGETTNVNFRIAHFNYWKYMGLIDSTAGLAINGNTPNIFGEITANHIVFMPDTPLFFGSMNSSNTTVGAIRGSELWATLQNTIYGELNAASCMDGHIIGHSGWLTTGINETAASMAGTGYIGCSNANAWADEYIGLCSEPMIYGSTVWSSSARDVGCKKNQLALYRLDPSWICGRSSHSDTWLGVVASVTSFAHVNNNGYANSRTASTSRGVRPFFLFA